MSYKQSLQTMHSGYCIVIQNLIKQSHRPGCNKQYTFGFEAILIMKENSVERATQFSDSFSILIFTCLLYSY